MIFFIKCWTYFIIFQVSIYYISPKTEGEKQLLAKGKLPIKVKNIKFWLRKKGAISSSKKKKKIQNEDDSVLSVDGK